MKSDTRKIFFIVLTLILMLAVQALSPFITQFWADTVTGFILISSVMIFNTLPCIIIALIFPFLAKIIGISELPIAILSVVAICNIIVVTIYTIAFQVFASNSIYQKAFTWGVSVVISALIKYGMLYFLVDRILLNILEINATVTYSFGSIQFFSSLLAGVLAFFVIKPIKRLVK